MNYLETLNKEDRAYMEILSSDFPKWLNDYINTKEMQRLKKVSVACGTDYLKLYNHLAFYDSLEHSVGGALITWNFTKDKVQTLASLFHDIATPVFKHCIDYFYGDYEKQEATEENTIDIIKNSKEIMALLKRDNISLESISDYHMYSICDNNSPQLSSDRLEYTLKETIKMNYGIHLSLDEIKKFYKDLIIGKDENGNPELSFKTLSIAEDFIEAISHLWPCWCDNKNKITFEFYAQTLKRLYKIGEITIDDLYKYSELEIIEIIRNSKNKDIVEKFNTFLQTTDFYESDTQPDDNNFWVSFNVKKRYINPLVLVDGEYKRITEVSLKAKEIIENFLNFQTKKYAYFDFNFKN